MRGVAALLWVGMDGNKPMTTQTEPPVLSILIPNFNNGVASSRNKATDLIGDLLGSLWDTLADDPTPLEILAFDDGSTDDSLQTLRDWSEKTWRGGQRFLTLMEEPHCGVLSVTANKLVRASKGRYLARLDGDIVIHTRNWAQRLVESFESGPRDLAVIGPKQLSPDGLVHSFGDFILHPKGYHHLCAGLRADMVTRAAEVDHVMGCFYCCTRGLFDELGGFDEDYMRGQTVDFGLRARLHGYRCWAVPTIEFTHRHTMRKDRATNADSEGGIDNSRAVFRDKWGFDRIAPDLDVVRERYANTPLLWNANVFGVAPGEDNIPASAPPTTIERSEWVRFNSDQQFQNWAMHKVAEVAQIIEQGLVDTSKPVVVPDCGSGLVVQLLAARGVYAVGIDRELGHMKLAQELAERNASRSGYRGEPPAYLHQPELRRLPLEDGAASLVCVFDRMEAHDNPVSLLKEARRVAGDSGAVLVMSKCPAIDYEQPLNPYRPLMPLQVAGVVKAVTDWQTLMDVRRHGKQHTLVVLASDRPAVDEMRRQVTAEKTRQALQSAQADKAKAGLEPLIAGSGPAKAV